MKEKTAPVAAPVGPVPAAPCIELGDGAPYIAALRCADCDAVFTRAHTRCQRCSSDKPMLRFRAGDRGFVTGYSIVMRTYPGVTVPFVSAIVELDSGVVLKGVLRDVEPSPKAIVARMPVRIAFGEVDGQQDPHGNPYIAFHFVPEVH